MSTHEPFGPEDNAARLHSLPHDVLAIIVMLIQIEDAMLKAGTNRQLATRAQTCIRCVKHMMTLVDNTHRDDRYTGGTVAVLRELEALEDQEANTVAEMVSRLHQAVLHDRSIIVRWALLETDPP